MCGSWFGKETRIDTERIESVNCIELLNLIQSSDRTLISLQGRDGDLLHIHIRPGFAFNVLHQFVCPIFHWNSSLLPSPSLGHRDDGSSHRILISNFYLHPSVEIPAEESAPLPPLPVIPPDDSAAAVKSPSNEDDADDEQAPAVEMRRSVSTGLAMFRKRQQSQDASLISVRSRGRDEGGCGSRQAGRVNSWGNGIGR